MRTNFQMNDELFFFLKFTNSIFLKASEFLPLTILKVQYLSKPIFSPQKINKQIDIVWEN